MGGRKGREREARGAVQLRACQVEVQRITVLRMCEGARGVFRWGAPIGFFAVRMRVQHGYSPPRGFRSCECGYRLARHVGMQGHSFPTALRKLPLPAGLLEGADGPEPRRQNTGGISGGRGRQRLDPSGRCEGTPRRIGLRDPASGDPLRVKVPGWPGKRQKKNEQQKSDERMWATCGKGAT